MKLLTKDIIKKLEKRGRVEEYKDSDPIITKFFNPTGIGTWYVMEGEKQSNNDWFFYGVAELNYTEWGYFTLSELEEVELPFGLGIERDKSFKGTYADIKVN